MSNHYQSVAEKIKEINEFYKINLYTHNVEVILEQKIKEVISFAKEHNVPVKITAQSIINRVKNALAGEEKDYEDESSEEESSDC
jgi:hypothetical protein